MPFLSLRATISALSAFSVAVVAAITLSITLTTSLVALRHIGETHATSLLANAKLQTNSLFHRPAIATEAIVGVVRGDVWAAPSDDLNVLATWEGVLRDQFLACEGYCNLILVLHDSTLVTISGYNTDVYLAYTIRGAPYSMGGLAYQLTQPIVVERTARFRANQTRVPANHPAMRQIILPFLMAVTPAWAIFGPGSNFQTTFGGVQILPDSGQDAVVVPTRIRDATGVFYGTTSIALDISAIPAYLRSIPGTPNTHIFAYDNMGYLIGSTMAAPYETQFAINASYVAGPGCSSTISVGLTTTLMLATCRAHMADYGFAPLTQIARDNASAFPEEDRVGLVAVAGDSLYIAVAPVKLKYPGMGLWLALVMPETDVLGDVVTGRNTAIGVTCGVFVLTTGVTFVAIALLLRPLSTIADRMMLAATLEDDESEGGKELSSMAEVEDLQQAYYAMNEELNRIKSFVPQTVLRKKVVDDPVDDEDSRTLANSDNASRRSDRSSLYRSKNGVAISPTSHLECGLAGQAVTVLSAKLDGFEAAVLEQARDAVVRGVGDTVRFVHEAAAAHKGVVQSFHGDHFVVTYNAVTPCAAHARRGVATAQVLSTGASDVGLKLALHAGVATGKCLVGNLGSAEAKTFNTIGAAFVQAGLLERLTQQYGPGCRVLATRRTLTDVATHFRFRYVDIVPLPQAAILIGAVLGNAMGESGNSRNAEEWLYVVGNASTSVDEAINDAFCYLADGKDPAFPAVVQERFREVDLSAAKDGIVCSLLEAAAHWSLVS